MKFSYLSAYLTEHYLYVLLAPRTPLAPCCHLWKEIWFFLLMSWEAVSKALV